MKKILLTLQLLAATFFAHTQNVGIGLTNPSAKLSISANGIELAGNAASNTFKTLAGTLSGTAGSELGLASFGFASTNNSSLGIRAYRSIAGSDWMSTSLLIEHDVDNNARVNGTFLALGAFGNVGIGNLTPYAPLSFNNTLGQKISLFGNASNNYGIGVQSYLMQLHTDAAASDIAFGYGASGNFFENMRIKGSGNVGIGTAQPASRLHIADSNFLDTARSTIIMSRYFASGADARASAIYHYYKSTPGNDQLVLGVSGDGGTNTSPALYSNAKMVIQANGNVGIGNNIPTEKLEINGNTKANNFIYTTPKNFYYSLSGIDFEPLISSDTSVKYVASGDITLQTTNPYREIAAPVHLPQGAALQSMTVYILDNSVPANLLVRLSRKSQLDNISSDNIGNVFSSGSTGAIAPYSVSLYPAVVDNSVNTYYLHAWVNNFSNPWSGNIYLRGIIIQYTLPSAQ